MALEQTTISDIKTRIIAHFESEFGSPIPLLSKAVWRVVATVMAGIYIILYEYGFDAMKQRFIQTANLIYLKIIGSDLNLTQTPATLWEGVITVISTASTETLPADTTKFLNKNTGYVYSVTSNTSLSIGSNSVPISATESGDAQSLSAGIVLNFVSAPAGATKEATIASTTIEGDDAETLEDFRARVLQRYRLKPQGGALIDYVIWLAGATNLKNTYPYATIGALQVDLHIEVDNQTDGIPTTTQLQFYYDNYINYNPNSGQADRRPVTAEINMLPITVRSEDIRVVALSPDTTEIKTAIETALEQVLALKEPYIQGVSVTRNDFIKKSQLSTAVQNVTDAYNATFDDIVLSNGGLPYSSDVLAKGQKTKLGTVTYSV